MRTANTGTTQRTAQRPAATKQSLARQVNDKELAFTSYGGDKVHLSISLTKQYFCPEASAAECYVFNAWCQHNRLDPWKREAYLIKYGGNPAQMVTAKEAFTRRAQHAEKYQGQQAGVVVLTADRKLENRIGEIVLDDEELVGGWAKVFVKGYIEPIESSVSFRERCQYKDGKPMAKWATSPALMIRKCALVAALREAFPDDVGGLYVADELGLDEDEINASAPSISKEDMANAQDAEFTDVEPETAAPAAEPEQESQSEFEKEFYGTGK